MIGLLQHPEWLSGALLTVASATLLLMLARLRHERRRFRLLGRRQRGPLGIGDALLTAALACIVLALVGPLFGTERVRMPATGLDLVVLLDVSHSMEAKDTPPSRLARARRAASQVLRELSPGDRAALVVFAGQAAALTPLTPDTLALQDLLAYVDTRLTSDPSSRLEAGLEAARATFDRDSARPRRLLVFSDGEHADDVSDATLAGLRRAGIRVVTAAIGSESGSTLPATRGQGRLLRDVRGEPVISRRNAANLERIAAQTQGSAWVADAFGGFPPDRLAAAVAAGATPAGDGFVEQEIKVVRMRLPAAVALLLLGFELVYLRPRRRVPEMHGAARAPDPPRRLRGIATAAVATLAVLTLGAEEGGPEIEALEAQLRRNPDDVHLLLELGVTRAREGQMREAERAFLAASLRGGEPELTALAYYDLGVALLSRGHYEGARDAFFDALAMDPGLEAARFNLEWSLRALSLELPPSGQGDAEESEDGGSDSDSGESSTEENESQQQQPDPGPEPARERPRSAPPLDAEEAARWLDAARDDPSRALRGAVGDGDERGPGSGPRW